jgi:hypothetical protein
MKILILILTVTLITNSYGMQHEVKAGTENKKYA